MPKKTYAIRYVAGQSVKRIFPPLTSGQLGQALPAGEPLPGSRILRVMVWNIYKQQCANWLSVLQVFGKWTEENKLETVKSVNEKDQ